MAHHTHAAQAPPPNTEEPVAREQLQVVNVLRPRRPEGEEGDDNKDEVEGGAAEEIRTSTKRAYQPDSSANPTEATRQRRPRIQGNTGGKLEEMPSNTTSSIQHQGSDQEDANDVQGRHIKSPASSALHKIQGNWKVG